MSQPSRTLTEEEVTTMEQLALTCRPALDKGPTDWYAGWGSPSCRHSAEWRIQDRASRFRLLAEHRSGRSHPTQTTLVVCYPTTEQ